MTANLITLEQSLFANLDIDVHKVPIDKRHHYRAVKYYLTVEDEPPSDATNLEKVHRHTESLHHSCQLQAWEPVQSILSFPICISTTTVSFSLPLCEYLIFKGLSTNLLEITDEIIHSFQRDISDISSTKILKARALGGTGNLPNASKIYEELCLEFSPDSETYIEAKAHLAMSQIQREMYQEGILNLNKALNLIESFLDSDSELPSKSKILELNADIIGQLAYYEMNLGRFKEAKNLYSKELQILEGSKSLHKLIYPLVHQGIILRKEFRIQESIESLIKARARAIEIQDEQALVWIAHHLAWAFRLQKKYVEAQENCLISLEGYKKIDDKRGINDSYELLGWIYLDKGKVNDAIENFNKALNWRKTNGVLQGAASCVMSLAIAYWRRGNLFKSVKTIFEGLNLYRKAGVLNRTRLFRVFTFARVFRNLLISSN